MLLWQRSFFLVVVLWWWTSTMMHGASAAPRLGDTYIDVFSREATATETSGTDLPTVELFALFDEEDGGREDHPVLNEVPLALDASGRDATRHLYYVARRLLWTNWDLSSRSELWLWWTGFELNGERLMLLREAPAESGGAQATCLADGPALCTWSATAYGAEYNISLFGASGQATVLPPALFARAGDVTDDDDVDEIRLHWSAQRGDIVLHAPFALGPEEGGVVVSSSERHHYNFAFSFAPAAGPGGTVTVTEDGMHSLLQLEIVFLLTLTVIGASLVLVYGWTTHVDSTKSVWWVVLYALPWVYPGSTLRILSLAMLNLRWIAETAANGAIGRQTDKNIMARISPAMAALETLWSATMLVHEAEINLSSVSAHMALLATAACDAINVVMTPRPATTQATLSRDKRAALAVSARPLLMRMLWSPHGLVIVNNDDGGAKSKKSVRGSRRRSTTPAAVARGAVVLYFLMVLTMVYVDDVHVYTKNQWGARYGLWPVAPAVVTMVAMMETALHLHE